MAKKYMPDQARLPELLELVKGSDSVELKLTVSDTDVRSVVQSLGMDPLDAQIRQAVFFDTPDLRLNQAGVVVRARRIQGGRGDTVIKLRPVVPAQLPDELRRAGSFGVEVDVIPGGFVCSASMKGKATAEEVRKVILQDAPIKGLFSKDQRAFYKQHAPEGLKLNDLSILGPITLLKLKYVPEGFPGVSWPSFGCSRTARASSSYRPSVSRARPCRSGASGAPTSTSAEYS